MSENNFYIHLSSNTKNKSDNTNTIGNFVTRLPRKINLADGWEVALTEVSYTKSWYNLFEDQKITLLCRKSESKRTKWLKAGNYDVEHLFHRLNHLLKEFKQDDFEYHEIRNAPPEHISELTPKFSYDKSTNKVKITLGKILFSDGTTNYVYPKLPGLLIDMLGLSYTNTNPQNLDYNSIIGSNLDEIDTIKKGNTVLNFGELNLNAGIHSIFLYCDLIQPVLVGHREVQLLRNVEIPNILRFGDQVVLKYQTPYYYQLLRNEFETIEIDIKDDTNRQLDFAFGRTSLSLHFRKIDQNVNESLYKLLH